MLGQKVWRLMVSLYIDRCNLNNTTLFFCIIIEAGSSRQAIRSPEKRKASPGELKAKTQILYNDLNFAIVFCFREKVFSG